MARPGDIRDLFCLVGGTGPDRERLATLAGKLGVGERVRFLGKVEEEELAVYYRACDLFAMLSRRNGADVEGLGIAFLDAAACGRPVLGTLAGGIPDAVEHGRTVSVNDAGERFKEELCSLARHRGCDAILAGHATWPPRKPRRSPLLQHRGWVESCTAILEDFDGNLELVDWAGWSRRQQGSGQRLPMPEIEPVPALA